jgi:hypothetical protein
MGMIVFLVIPVVVVLLLTEELTSTENRVSFARQAYNDSVMSYNNAREVFPSSMVAGMCGFQPAQLGAALPRLEKLHPLAKQAAIEGLVKTVGRDGMLNVSEAELLRTVCAILHCPLPGLLPPVV